MGLEKGSFVNPLLPSQWVPWAPGHALGERLADTHRGSHPGGRPGRCYSVLKTTARSWGRGFANGALAPGMGAGARTSPSNPE